jgi:hypothetical protein
MHETVWSVGIAYHDCEVLVKVVEVSVRFLRGLVPTAVTTAIEGLGVLLQAATINTTPLDTTTKIHNHHSSRNSDNMSLYAIKIGSSVVPSGKSRGQRN